jgi:hypothetical protein
MWVIEHTRWDDGGQEYSQIVDVVDTYENLVHYFQVLLLQLPHLKASWETIPRGTYLKHSIPVLEGAYESYSIIRYLPVYEPEPPIENE